MIHFQQGLPHNRFSVLDFAVEGHLFSVCAVIQYVTEPVDHFVVWIRDYAGMLHKLLANMKWIRSVCFVLYCSQKINHQFRLSDSPSFTCLLRNHQSLELFHKFSKLGLCKLISVFIL